MVKRALFLGAVLIATQLLTGCCWYGCHRPFIFRRAWIDASYYGGACCGSEAVYGAPVHADYGPPPMAPAGPGMPPATNLTRR